MNSSDRWLKHRAGLFSYWNYGFKEFVFRDGNLLLFGANGTGKSLTMQALFPPLLDADFRSERLDANRKKGKQIGDYVLGLGSNRKDNNIAYVFTEFHKPTEPGKYITICYGLDMSIHRKGRKFIGFVAAGPVRIFSEEHAPSGSIRLFRRDEAGTRAMKAVGFADLERRIKEIRSDSHGRIDIRYTERESEYAKIINDMLFAYDSMSEYDNLINVLLSIRSPRAGDSEVQSDKGKEKQIDLVNNTLSDSLSPLPDSHFEELANLMSGIDERREELKQLQEQHAKIAEIKTVYDKYAASVTLHSLEKLKEFQSEADKHNKSLSKSKSNLDLKRNEHERESDNMNQAQRDLANLLGQMDALKKSDDEGCLDNLKETQKALEEAREDTTKNQVRVDKTAGEVKGYQEDIEEAEERIQEHSDWAELAIKDAQFNALSQSLWYITPPEIETTLSNIVSHIRHVDATALDINKMGIQAGDIRTLEDARAKTNSELDVEREQSRQLSSRIRQTEQILEDKRNLWFDAYAPWRDQAIEAIGLTAEDSMAIGSAINILYHANHRTEIANLTDEPYRKAQAVVNSRKLTFLLDNNTKETQIKATITELRQTSEKLRKELAITEKQKDIPFVVPNEIALTHKWLKEEEIPFAFLYEMVDFLGHLTDAQKAHVENALIQTGLLDAIFVPNTYKELLPADKPVKLLASVVEKNQTGTDNAVLAVALPPHLKEYRQEIETLLSHLTNSNGLGLFYVEHGQFSHGLVAGQAWSAPIQYVGTETRRLKWEATIARLKEEIALISQLITDAEEELKENESARKCAEKLCGEFPPIDELRKTFKDLQTFLSDQTHLLDVITKLEAKHELEMESLKKSIARFEEDWPAWYKLISTEFSGSWRRGCEHINKHPDMIRQYKEYIEGAEENLRSRESLIADKVRLEETLVAARARLTEYEDELYTANDKVAKLSGKVTALLRIVEDKGLINLADRIQSLDKQITEKDDMVKKLFDKVGSLRGAIESVKPVVEEMERKSSAFNGLLTVTKNVATDLVATFFPEKSAEPHEAIENFCKANGGNIESIRDLDENIVTKYTRYYGMYGMGSLNVQPRKIYSTVYLLGEDFKHHYATLEDSFGKVRYIIGRDSRGRNISLTDFVADKKQACDDLSAFIDGHYDELFKKWFAEGMEYEIQEKIKDGMAWTAAINGLLAKTKMSSHDTEFKINWVPRPRKKNDLAPVPLETVVQLIQQHALLAEVDYDDIRKFFRHKLEIVREIVRDDQTKIYKDALIEEFDYRKWFIFQIKYNSDNTNGWEDLTQQAYVKLSGGEKAMAIYLPLISAVSARFDAAGKKDCPRFIVMDEAFTVVDKNNTNECFKLIKQLDINYIINSQSIDGAYPEIPSLSIYHFGPGKGQTVPILHYEWDGNRKIYPEVRQDGRNLNQAAATIPEDALFGNMG